MLIAEALKEKKDLIDDISSLKNRIKTYSKVQEGQNPDEDVNELISEYETKSMKVLELTKLIEMTNSKVTAKNGKTINELLAEYQNIISKRKFYDSLSSCKEDDMMQFRYSRSEIPTITTINMKEIRKKVDSLSKQLRELDNVIQTLNWSNELIA